MYLPDICQYVQDDDSLFCSQIQNIGFDTIIMSNGVIRRSVSLIAGKAVRTILPASFRRHSLLDSESIPSQLSVYCESIPSLRRPKTHIRAYGTSTYGAMHGLKIRVSAVQIRPCPFHKFLADSCLWPSAFFMVGEKRGACQMCAKFLSTLCSAAALARSTKSSATAR